MYFSHMMYYTHYDKESGPGHAQAEQPRARGREAPDHGRAGRDASSSSSLTLSNPQTYDSAQGQAGDQLATAPC